MELGEMSRPGEEIGRVRALFMASVTARSQAERPLRFLWVFQGDVAHRMFMHVILAPNHHVPTPKPTISSTSRVVYIHVPMSIAMLRGNERNTRYEREE